LPFSNEKLLYCSSAPFLIYSLVFKANDQHFFYSKKSPGTNIQSKKTRTNENAPSKEMLKQYTKG
jgi:hypothetical protein